MRYYDEDEAARLEAQPWQVALLELNPGYISWGPHEDYMMPSSSGNNKGWREPAFFDGWDSFDWELNDLNELASFYFSVRRDSERCETCDATGLAPDAKAIADGWYDFAGRGVRWSCDITQDEADALWDAGRLSRFDEKPPAEQVNALNRPGARSLFGGHDAINRWICIDQRLKRLGLYEDRHCSVCSGEGHNFTAPEPHVALTLWMLLPRKGCSRGVEIKNIKQGDLPAIKAYLQGGADRNAQRFAAITQRGTTP